MKNIFYIAVLMILFNNIINAQLSQTCVTVKEGWNLVGAPCGGSISSIVTYGLNTSLAGVWYEFDGGYNEVTDLVAGKGYWVKLHVTGPPPPPDPTGTICFACVNSQDCGTVEHGGKIYHTVIIGTQCWLKENLDVGTMIPGTQDASDNSVIEKYCYDDDPLNCCTYGALYQWDEAIQYSLTPPGAQGICPDGWHIPTLLQLQTLETNVGDGNALKEIGQGTGNGAGTNTSGFSALLTGGRVFPPGSFYNLGVTTAFWSSTEGSATSAYYLSLDDISSGIYVNHTTNEYGFSVRCLKN